MARNRRKATIESSKNFVIEDFRNPPKKQVSEYRRKKVGNHVLTIAVLRREGPRGGRTIVTSVWHPKTERKSSNPAVTRALKAFRKKRR